MRRSGKRLMGPMAALFFASLPRLAAAAENGAPHLDGGELGLVWVVPFVGILLSIAVFPLAAPRFWHRHFGKVSAFWALAFLVPFAVGFGLELTLYEVLHTALLEYIPFIILLLALFTVAGGIRLKGDLKASPAVNTGLLGVGTAIASWMGTTGAAMLLIRPVIRANRNRRYNVHVIVFFIFLVANIGGSLTPLGDPPLFLGFLKGVHFFWPTVHMFLPMLFVAGVLLVGFYLLDSVLFRRETIATSAGLSPTSGEGPLRIEGWPNVMFLAAIVGTVLMSGLWRPGIHFAVYHVEVELQNLVRDVVLLAITVISFSLTDKENRRLNAFSWFPIVEVAKLFAGIFLTIVPAIAILKAGTSGAMAPLVSLVSDSQGGPVDEAYFWLTGLLSSFLDNAPTYLVFFNTAGGDPVELMGPLASTLLAISAGAVFMGANTYIGNAPNFMVRAIAEESGIKMPSFFGYMVWSIAILGPLFVAVTFIFFL